MYKELGEEMVGEGECMAKGEDISGAETERNKDGRVEEGDRMGMGRRRIGGWLGWQSCSVTTLLLPLINSPRFCRSYHCRWRGTARRGWLL